MFTWKVQLFRRICIWFFCVLLLSGCAHFFPEGPHVLIGTERQPADHEQVVLYEKPPERYELIAYVEGWHGYKDSSTVKKIYPRAVEKMKKAAAGIGANGVVQVSIVRVYNLDTRTQPYGQMWTASGWAVYVPDGAEALSDTDVQGGEREKEQGVRIFIELPEECEILRDLFSRGDFTYFQLTSPADLSAASAVQKALDELKQKVLELEGNGLYIRKIRKRSESRSGLEGLLEMMEDIFLDDGSSTYGYQVDDRIRFYEIYGQAIRVSFDDSKFGRLGSDRNRLWGQQSWE
jgi:hypothetical protein